MPLEPGAFTSIFSGNRIHVEGPGSGPVTVAPSGGTGTGIQPEPSESQIDFMAVQLMQHRIEIEHAGWNPFPWVRRFRPQTQEDAALLLGIARLLTDPEFTPNDMRSIASMIVRENKVAKYFMYL